MGNSIDDNDVTKIRPIDVHTHIFSPAMIERRNDLGEIDSWFNVTHQQTGAEMITGEILARSTVDSHFDRSIAVGWPWESPELCREHNHYLAEVGASRRDTISWMGIVQPLSDRVEEEIAWCAQHGAIGIGELNADAQSFDWLDTDSLQPMMRALEQHRLPLLVHSSEPVGHFYPGKGTATPDKLMTAIMAFPDVKWILAHWGGGLPFYELMKHVRNATSNVWYDSAASTYLYSFSIFPSVVEIIGSERILFGTDYPLLGQRRFFERIVETEMTDNDLRNIASENAKRLFGFEKVQTK